jgi:phage terminase small subunit
VADLSALNPRQKAFVQEYLVDLNATQAAIRAGYSERTARVQGPRLLSNVAVQREIEKGQDRREKRLEITADRIRRELARIAFGDAKKVMSWGPDGVELLSSDDLTDDESAQVAEVSQTITQHGGTIKLKRFDKVKALELLGRDIGMFRDEDEEDDEDAPKANIYLPDNGRG